MFASPLPALDYTVPVSITVRQRASWLCIALPISTSASGTDCMYCLHSFLNKLSLLADMLYMGVRTRHVKPTGATTPYAAPELLHSLQRQWEGAEDDEEFVMINGPAADIWSFACVCYQMSLEICLSYKITNLPYQLLMLWQRRCNQHGKNTSPLLNAMKFG